MPVMEIGVPHPGNNRDGILLRFPFDEDVNAELMDEIHPGRDRGFKPELEGWWVAAEHATTAESILLRRWPEILIVGNEGGDYILNRRGDRVSQFGLFG
jgi:hypothetical protein